MTQSKAKPKAKGTSRTNKPRKSATARLSSPKSKSPAKTGSKAKPGAEAKRANENAGSRFIDERIRSLGGWRAETLAQVRRLIREADPDIVEECKWIKPTNPLGVPVWSHAGIVCTGEAYKQVVKLTFARGARIPDPSRLFNSSLEGNTRRAIDIHEGEKVNAGAFKALVKAAVAQNGPPTKKAKPSAKEAKPVKLISGGNPRIAKADGDAPVQAYIAAMPLWKRDLGKRLDALIARNVRNVRKAVKWNSPFYGIEGQGWFLSFHVFTHYVKVTFFRGTSLRPVPTGGTGKDARWIDIREGDQFDEAQMTTWVKQAAVLHGWDPSQSSATLR
jgi:hypothetical protein